MRKSTENCMNIQYHTKLTSEIHLEWTLNEFRVWCMLSDSSPLSTTDVLYRDTMPFFPDTASIVSYWAIAYTLCRWPRWLVGYGTANCYNKLGME